MIDHKYNEDYYIRGQESGISNYTNYRWLPELTVPMACTLKTFLNIRSNERLLDFGCARGYLVRALRALQIDAYGYDISEWAIANCDHQVIDYVHDYLDFNNKFEFLFCKDVLEHIPQEELEILLPKLFSMTTTSALFIVPLAINSCYISPDDEKDITHIHRQPLDWWIRFLGKYAENFAVMGCLNIPILKLSINKYPGSAGFIYCKKLI